MTDDKDKRGADRRLVSANQDYEVEYLMKKFSVSRDAVVAAIKAAGPERDAVEARLTSQN